MKPSRKFLSLPIISLKEGQQIGFVKSLILDAKEKAVAALVVDPKGFFKDQRIIPYAKVVSVGDDAITIDKESHVEKSTSIPEILDLLKEKLGIIGTKVITESGKILGIAEEYYIDQENGKIGKIEVSGGKLGGLLNGKAWLDAEQLVTIGHDVIVAQKGSESVLAVADKGLNDTLKSFLHTTSHLATEKTQTIGQYFRKNKGQNEAEEGENPTGTEIPAEDSGQPPVSMAMETPSGPDALKEQSIPSEGEYSPEPPTGKETLG